MKPILFFILFLVCYTGSNAQIKFDTFPDYEAALKKSKESKKPMLIDTYADWCGWCKYMDKNIFSDTAVGNYFNENFLCYKLDTEIEKNEYFSIKYNISGLPCLLLLNENGEILHRNDGAITDKEEFIKFGQMAYYKLFPETSPWKKNEDKFNEGERSSAFLKDYALSMVDGGYPQENIMKVVSLYWQQASDKSITNEQNFEVFFHFHNDFSDVLYPEFLSSKSKIIALFGEDAYYGKCAAILKENLNDAISSNDKALYDKVLDFAKKEFKGQEIYNYDSVISFVEDSWKKRDKN